MMMEKAMTARDCELCVYMFGRLDWLTVVESFFFCSFLDLERDVRVPNLFFFSFLSASFCITLVGGGGWLNGIV